MVESVPAWSATGPNDRLPKHRRDELMARATSVQARAVTECLERRTRVLAFPDLAHELTRPPLRLGQPEQWNGFIPPAEHDGRINNSPIRAQLILITKAVAQAEQESAG